MSKNNEIWVEIEKHVLRNASFRDINFIIQLLSWPSNGSTKYNFFIKATKPYLESVPNYQQLLSIDKELLLNKINDAAISGKINKPKYKITFNNNRQRNEFTIQEFVRFFQSPVLLILENSLNDGYFIRTLFDFFSPKNADNKSKLTEFLNNDWIQFVNAGGWTNIRNYIEGRINGLNTFARKQGRAATDFIKCFVLIDSDKLYHSYTDAKIQDKQRLKSELEAYGMQVHILNKRAMENYMPDEIISALPTFKRQHSTSQNWVNVYSHLSKEQKDYLNYQKGFEQKDESVEVNGKISTIKVNRLRTEQPQGIQDLYSNISNPNYDIIDTGLNQFPNFKKEFPKFFKKREYVNKETLLNREGGTEAENEFLEIIEKIMKLL